MTFLFSGGSTTFENDGLGPLSDIISGTVTEERNGEYELEMVYPVTGLHYSEIETGTIIYARHDDTDDKQPFRVYKISRPINQQVTINAQHISYQLSKEVVKPCSGTTCSASLAAIKANAVDCPFTFSTDKDTSAAWSLDKPSSIRSILGGEDGSILDVYGGEYKWDNWTVSLLSSRGSDNGVEMRYAKNITDLTNETDASNIYTAIIPYWTGNDTTVTGDVVKSDYYDSFPYGMTQAVDFSSALTSDEDGYQPTVAQLDAVAASYLTANKTWLLSHNITLSFVPLWQSDEYSDIAPLERVSLCDTVTVKYTSLDVDVKMKCIKTTFDLTKDRMKEIELGDAKSTLSESILETAAKQVFGTSSASLKEALANAGKMMNGGLDGHIVFNYNANGQMNEILAMDTSDKSTATQVLRINKNGIGFGTGYNGPWTTLWTLDGNFIADCITAGTIKDAAGNCSWNLTTGLFTISSATSSRKLEIADAQLNVYDSTGKNGISIHDNLIDFYDFGTSNNKCGNITPVDFGSNKYGIGIESYGGGDTFLNADNGGAIRLSSTTSSGAYGDDDILLNNHALSDFTSQWVVIDHDTSGVSGTVAAGDVINGYVASNNESTTFYNTHALIGCGGLDSNHHNACTFNQWYSDNSNNRIYFTLRNISQSSISSIYITAYFIWVRILI